MPIQSPFGKTPYYFDMLNVYGGKTTAVGSGIVDTIAGGTTITGIQLILPWQVVFGNTYWSVIWDHGSASSATGGMKLNLVDQTNGVVLYVFSSNTTTAPTFSTLLATSVVFVKPSGVARIALQYQNNDTTGRAFELIQSAIVVF